MRMDDGDDEVWAQLYPSLRRFAAVVGDWGLEPDDLVQEALAQTLRRHTLGDLDDPGAYLRTAIANIARSGRRRRKAGLAAVTRLARAEPHQDQMPSELTDLERLSPIDRAVVYLVHVEGRAHLDAARILGITEQASRSRASRATGQLRTAVNEEMNHGPR